ncbi:hypothetical protein PUNSTDRAFT_92349 [Punctularia strigosozonata HHB-11173 SS5]|uniref:Peptidase M48 domain-containing protein n=1 Tax=Punctularia strigosozonata (strain HHB-11173) TaxID=741275 RepID=R7S4Z7_PUNST|nr:uncharacterized protein PUNSTDRAFT_92349 [Punctularia strigosozonata HHB-11173 SS5]EIN04902.1 hypothetical protein PUNSTDRAFT_92349 [Punctularia strigosozonata HHB-11173 SS5]
MLRPLFRAKSRTTATTPRSGLLSQTAARWQSQPRGPLHTTWTSSPPARSFGILSGVNVPRINRRGGFYQPASATVLPSADIGISQLRRPCGVRMFHSTKRNEGLPALLPVILGALKASTALETARMIGRVALTFAPVILFKNHKSKKVLRYVDNLNNPQLEEKRTTILKRIRKRQILFHALVLTPIVLFWAAIFASLERTPLTGRWRVILLAPEEEDEIANQLAGAGWFSAVGEILSENGAPTIVPPSDWRYVWVNQILRQLEGIIPAITAEGKMPPLWLERGENDVPLPPPAKYPLKPRPRGAEWLRNMCELLSGQKTTHISPHTIQGPPYSLMLVENPDVSNAFSYGFGPDGAGGIVVYTGFLDEIIAKTSNNADPQPANSSWWSSFLGGFSSVAARPPHPVQTPQQSTDLAILLAHELSHLLLAHHLETLSSATVVVPGLLSMLADVVRVLLFPVTMVFGPFVNDAVAQIGKMGHADLTKLTETCSGVKQEIEADVVSARLLAYAGYDPREAVNFWQNRRGCSPNPPESEQAESPGHRSFQGSHGHPIDEVRVEKLREELVRWQTERERVLSERAAEKQDDAS